MPQPDATARYRCSTQTYRGREQVVVLEDCGTGMDVAIAPRRGADWCAFGMRDVHGERRELLHPAVHFDWPGGSPVLFPVTGRSLCDGKLGRYRHRGAVYRMPIHGFARNMPWEVTDRGADAASAWVTCRLTDTEATRALYPYPFAITLTYRLQDGTHHITARVENPGTEPLPFHLGYHPYFRTPILPDGDRRRCRMAVPSESTWELERLCATGRRLPMAPDEAFWPERPLGDETMDRVFADLRTDPADGLVRCWVRDPDAGCRIEVAYDPMAFPVFVVYTSPETPFVCLEPWTGLPGGLGDDTAAGQGARRLAPGETFESTVSVSVRQ